MSTATKNRAKKPAAATRQAFVEDVEWLLEMGADPWTIPSRVGVKSQSKPEEACRARLRRAGRADLAARITSDPWLYEEAQRRNAEVNGSWLRFN